MKADLPNQEPKSVERWNGTDLYSKILQKNKDKGKFFVLHDGPPYANGSIHHGHVLNKVLKDFIVKYKSLCGYHSEFIPGWDCHGLPIEQKILEESIQKKTEALDPIKLRKECSEYADKFVDIQSSEFQRMLIFADWKNPYKTKDFSYQASIVRSLSKWAANGWLYQAFRPVYWDVVFKTALAESEIEYEDNHISPSAYVAFPTTDNPDLSVVIWTTTPWTLLSNEAVALNPNFDYVVLLNNQTNKSYIVSSDRATAFMEAVGWNLNHIEISSPKPASEFANLALTNPLLPSRSSKVVFADYVTNDSGTGCVHIAPAHGPDDFQVGLKNNLKFSAPIADDGVYTNDAGAYAGLHIFKANQKILSDLKDNGSLLSSVSDTITHKYPYSWRSKKQVIYLAKSQWFLKLDDVKSQALSEVEKTTWIPQEGKSRIVPMIEKRPDWCISRQRHWGVPIPVFFCRNCNQNLISSELMLKCADLFEKEGSDIWWSKPSEYFIDESTECQSCHSKNCFEKYTDIVDVWFDSGTSWQAVKQKLVSTQDQADLYLEGSDQHRGWFNSSLFCNIASNNKAPYKAVLTHGFVLGDDGEKLSKSKKNYLPIDKALSTYGAEILRLWVANTNFTEDVCIGKLQLEGSSKQYQKIRNTIRFILGNIYDLSENDFVSIDHLDPSDEMFIDRFMQFQNAVVDAYEEYKFSSVTRLIFDFCSDELSSHYFDSSKDILYCDSPNSHSRRSVQSALFMIGKNLLKLIAPLLPHTADEAWSLLPVWAGKSESVFLDSKDVTKFENINEENIEKLKFFKRVKEVLNKELEKLRSEKTGLKNSEIALNICVSPKYRDFFVLHDEIQRFMMVSEAIGFSYTSSDNDEIKLTINRHDGVECQRCREYFGGLYKERLICGRCYEAEERTLMGDI